jgi:choline dehydrogenase-like flavoprotein
MGRAVPWIRLVTTAGENDVAREMRTQTLELVDAFATPQALTFQIHDLKPHFLFHEAGTCAMGASRQTSVADAFGQVWGTPGLFVADASVMPTALPTYPTLTLVALAMRTADHIGTALARRDF